MTIDNGLGDDDVVGGGDLDVLTVPLHECDVVAITLHHRGIVRKAVVIRLTVGSLEQLDVERLWGLYQTVSLRGTVFEAFSLLTPHSTLLNKCRTVSTTWMTGMTALAVRAVS